MNLSRFRELTALGTLAWAIVIPACSSSEHGSTSTSMLTGDGAPDGTTADAGTDAIADGPDAGGPAITNVAIVANPNSVLSATLTFTTSVPAIGQATLTNVAASDNTVTTPAETTAGLTHTINLLGMRATSSFDVTVTATDTQGRASHVTAPYATGALPSWIPPITIVQNDPTKTSPGYTMINLDEFHGDPALPGGPGSSLLIVDPAFQIVWYYDHAGVDPEKIPNGDLVFKQGNGWTEIDMMGNLVKHEVIKPRDLDHAFQPEQNGDYLSLIPNLEDISGFDAGKDAAPATYPLVGSVFVEIPPDGAPYTTLANTFDFFNPHRQGDPKLFQSSYWDFDFPDAGKTKDWIHANAIVPDYSDGNIVASSRTQGWIFKFTRQGKLLWRLGQGGDFTLTNPNTTPAAASWQYGQHGAYITPAGTIMCFDDGNGRPRAPGCDTGDAGAQACEYSRAVEYSIDQVNMKATIVWEYGSTTYGDPDNMFSQLYGSSYVLPGGTVLICDGVESTDRLTTTANPKDLKWARIIEVTHAMPPVKIAEFDIQVPLGQYPLDPKYSGFGVYRAYRLPSLYAGSLGSADNGM